MTTTTETKRAEVTTPSGLVVTITLTHEQGMPHVEFSGASGSHRIAVPEQFGGRSRAIGHAFGFLSEEVYGYTTEHEAVARALVAQVMPEPVAPVAAPVARKGAPSVRFEFHKTESTGYVRVYATFQGRTYKVATAAYRFTGHGTPRAASVRMLKALPKAVAEAARAQGVETRAYRMALRVPARKAR